MKTRTLLTILFVTTLAVSGVSAADLPWHHDVGPVYSFIALEANNRTRYHIHSVGLNYFVQAGRVWGPIISTTVLTPVAGSSGSYDPDSNDWQDKESMSIWSYYNIPLGFDLLVGIGSNTPTTILPNRKYNDTMRMNGSVGFHMNGLYLGHTQYENRKFYSLTGGFGVDMRTSWRISSKLLIGTMLNINADFIDFLNSDGGMTMFLSLNAGVFIRFDDRGGAE